MRLLAALAICLSAAAATAQTAPVVIEAAPPVNDPGQEMVCKKVKETGSLVKSKRTCHTKAQWAYIDDQNQRVGRQMVEDGTTRPAGN